MELSLISLDEGAVGFNATAYEERCIFARECVWCVGGEGYDIVLVVIVKT
jgi:hypothetical protein